MSPANDNNAPVIHSATGPFIGQSHAIVPSEWRGRFRRSGESFRLLSRLSRGGELFAAHKRQCLETVALVLARLGSSPAFGSLARQVVGREVVERLQRDTFNNLSRAPEAQRDPPRADRAKIVFTHTHTARRIAFASRAMSKRAGRLAHYELSKNQQR